MYLNTVHTASARRRHNLPPSGVLRALDRRTASGWRVDEASPAHLTAAAGRLRLSYRFENQPGERVLLLGPPLTVTPLHHWVDIEWSHRAQPPANSSVTPPESASRASEATIQLVLLVEDDGGELYSYGPCPHSGGAWQVDLKGLHRASWGGDGDGALTFPLRRAGFVLWPATDGLPNPPAVGELTIDHLCFVTPMGHLAETMCRLLRRLRDLRRGLSALPKRVEELLTIRLEQHRKSLVAAHRALSNLHPEAPDPTLVRHRAEVTVRRLEAWLELRRAAPPRGPAAEMAAVAVAMPEFIKQPRSSLPRLGPADDPTRLDLWAPKGGMAAAQIVLHSLEELTEVDLVVARCEDRDDSGVAAHIAWFTARAIEIQATSEGSSPTSGEVPGRTDPWPDALCPRTPLGLAADTSRVFWIRIEVPAHSRPGLMLGLVSLRIAGAVLTTFEMRLRILDPELPQRPSLPVLVGLDDHAVARFYGRRELDGASLERWIEFLARRRLHADPLVGSCNWWHAPQIPRGPSSPAILRRQKQRFGLLWAARASNRLLELDGTFPSTAEQHWLDQLPRWAAQVESQRGEARVFLYTYDEPGAELYGRIEPFLAACRRRAPRLEVVLTFFRDDPTVALAPYVDVWCPHVAWVARHPDRIRELRRRGASLWWYLTDDAPPFPSLRLEAAPLHQRILFWLTFHYDFGALLYWETCHWHRNMDQRPHWPASPWRAQQTLDGVLRGSGNGNLLYPGPELEPYSSLRLETLQLGSQDHELLSRLASELQRGRLSAQAARQAQRLLDLSDLITEVDDFVTDPRLYETRRRAIAELLHRGAANHHKAANHHREGDSYAMRKCLDPGQIRAREEGLGKPLSPP